LTSPAGLGWALITLIRNYGELLAAVAPILGEEVSHAAFDTETSEVFDERFTPYATDTRIAGLDYGSSACPSCPRRN
jgi:hypothetical protein